MQKWPESLRWGKIEVTGGFVFLMAWLNYTDTQGLLLPVLTAAALHELGHWAAVRLQGGHVSRLRLSAVGAEMQLEGTLSYRQELSCALAGPGTNLLLASWSVLCAGERGWLFAGVNLLLGCFNLLPVRGLDGGRALYSVLACGMGPEWAVRLSGTADKVLVSLLVIGGVATLAGGGNMTLLLIGLWLSAAIGKNLPEKGVVKDGRNR